MGAVTDEQLVERLEALLAESDLQTTTEKMLRKKLEEEFSIDLTDKKGLIRAQVEAYLTKQAGDDDDDDADEDAAPRRGGFSANCTLSPELAEFLGVETLPRSQVVKKLWEHIKANNLQDPADKRKIILDDALQKLFKAPLTMFSMNSQLSKHVFTAASNEDGEGAGGSDDAPKAKAAAKRKADDAEAPKSGGGGGFQKPIPLSEPLAAFCGKPAASRGELTKIFWNYWKANELQDPADKRFIKSDATMKDLLGVDRFQAFKLQKLLKNHLK